MRRIIFIIGVAAWLLSGAYLLIVAEIGILKCWGLLGSIITILIFPITIAIYPFAYWSVEKVFPTGYFIIWAINCICYVVMALTFGDE